MKKFFLLFLLLLISPLQVQSYNIVCPSESVEIIEKESVINKLTGLNFASKKIVEIAIQKVLNDEFYKSNINADLDIFNINRLRKGEFKSLSLKTKLLRYRALSMSNFYAQTVCSYNKVVQQNKKVYFPIDLPLKFEGTITNLDIQNVLNSEEFQRELKKINIIQTPKVNIQNGYLNFVVPVKTFFNANPFNIKFKANIEVENKSGEKKSLTFSEIGINADDIIRTGEPFPENVVYGNDIYPIKYGYLISKLFNCIHSSKNGLNFLNSKAESDSTFNPHSSDDFMKSIVSNKNGELYVEASGFWPTVQDVIEFAKKTGGVAILAHPFGYNKKINIHY